MKRSESEVSGVKCERCVRWMRSGSGRGVERGKGRGGWQGCFRTRGGRDKGGSCGGQGRMGGPHRSRMER